MAIFFDAEVSPDALTAFVREVPMAANLALSNAIPTRAIDGQTVDFREMVHTNRTAKFRAFDGAISTMGRDGGSEYEVGLLPLSNSINMGEYERIQIQFARTGGTNKAAIANAIYNDAQNLVASIRNRIELAWGDVLTDGKLTISENGLTGTAGEADFGVPAEHLVTAAKSWLDPTATILDDLFAWQETYANTPGAGDPGAIRTARKVIRAMQKNTQIVNAIKGTATGTYPRVTVAELNTFLDSEGLPNVVELTDLSLDVDGTPTRVMPDNRVLLTPANLGDLGFTAYGVTATSLELVGSNATEMSFADAPGIVGVVEKVGPPYRQFTFVDAVAMPVLSQPKRLFVATV